MFSFLQKEWMGLAAFALFITLSAAPSFSATTPLIAPDCTCNAPSNVSVTNQTSNSISLAWSPVLGAAAYEVWYERTSDGYTSSPATVSSTSISYAGLAAGSYKFHVRSNCGNGVSDIIVLEDIFIG
jgi:hypothetical protein